MTIAEYNNKFEMIQIIVNAANEISNIAKSSFIKKKPFGTKGKTPERRMKRKSAFPKMAFTMVHAAAQIHVIQVRPIPKYELGSPKGGIAICDISPNDNIPELILIKKTDHEC